MNYNASFLKLMKSEIAKITTLRSSWIVAGIAIIMTIGFTWLSANGVKSYVEYLGDPMTGHLSSGIVIAMISILVMFTVPVACLAVTNEYTSNTIQMSLLSTNSRMKFYSAKTLSFIGWWTLVSLLCLLGSIIIASIILGSAGFDGFDFTNGKTLMSFFAFIATIIIICMMSIGMATILRSTAGSITAMFALLFVLQIIAAIPVDFIRDLAKYMPFSLLMLATNPRDVSLVGGDDFLLGGNSMSPDTALAIFAVWGVALLGLGAWRLAKTDA